MGKNVKDYTVILRFQFPAWDEKDGIEFQVSAASKSEANNIARRQAELDGHTCAVVGKGRYSFKAYPVI